MEHNRYLIYELLNQHIKATIPKRYGGYNINGKATEVIRDVLENKIFITVNKVKYVFKEPDSIIQDDNDILMVYGIENTNLSPEETDAKLLDMLHNTSLRGGHIDNTLDEIGDDIINFITFTIG